MSDCTNMEMERLLHDYELDMLSAQDKRLFEMHLYDCDHCLSRIREFIDVSRIIRHDLEAQTIMQNVAGGDDHAEAGHVGKRTSRFLRYLVAAVIVAVITVPAYRYWLQSNRTTALQTLELLPSRSGGNDIVYLDKGGDLEISFYVSENYRNEADLVITSIDGDTVLHTPGFDDFDDNGLGSIELPVSTFSAGHYMLSVRPKPQTGLEELVYMFTVK